MTEQTSTVHSPPVPEVPEEELLALARALVRADSPNPPGDTAEVAAVAEEYLVRHKIPFRKLMVSPGKINLWAHVKGGLPGPHLVMNAHLDVFPWSDSEAGKRTAERTETEAGLPGVFGRGAVDMKGGAAAFLVTLRLLHEQAETLAGTVSLCLVCDEETFGPDGSSALLAEYPELYGDALLSSEPSSTGVVRQGERGFMWAEVVFVGDGGHGAYPSVSPDPIERAAAFIAELRGSFPQAAGPSLAGDLREVLAPEGESFVDRISLSFGKISGGVKVNMKPADCRMEIDIRVPVGASTSAVVQTVEGICSSHRAELNVFNSGEPNMSSQDDPLFQLIGEAVREVTGTGPRFAVGLGCSDARLWRHGGVPAAVYGPDPSTMATDNEHVSLQELSVVTQVHLRTAIKFLSRR